MNEHNVHNPTYPLARAVAARVAAQFARQAAAAAQAGLQDLAPLPEAGAAEALIEAGFWASLLREEGRVPMISLALLPPERAAGRLLFAQPQPLTPTALVKLSPAVKRPGIHLGVWGDGDAFHVWGTTRVLPCLCFVLEVIEPGHLVVKYRRSEGLGKFGNVAELEGDQVKIVDAGQRWMPDVPDLLRSLTRFDARSPLDASAVLIQLAVSMRAHGQGGILLVVPAGTDAWHASVIGPPPYLLAPPFTDLAELTAGGGEEEALEPARQEALHALIGAVAGLTAVDGATVLGSTFEVLAFGVKLRRADAARSVPEVLLSQPIEGTEDRLVPPGQVGGMRHVSAAQFVYDQRDALALVASQDRRFTILAWSPARQVVRAHQVEALLL